MTDTIQLTSEQIAKYRSELADNSDFLAALDVIEEWDGDLADAAESIATRNDIEALVQCNCEAETLTRQGINREHEVEAVLPKLALFAEYQERQQELVES